MKIFSIEYAKKSAQTFFEPISGNQINFLIDIRLYNLTQLAWFSKGKDLKYFLKAVCNCDYVEVQEFAPSTALFNNYKKGYINWIEYEKGYNGLLLSRNLDIFIEFRNKRICLLCAEDTPERCHRRFLVEKLANTSG